VPVDSANTTDAKFLGVLGAQAALHPDYPRQETDSERIYRESLGLGPLLHVSLMGGSPTADSTRLCDLAGFLDGFCDYLLRWRVIRQSAATRLGLQTSASAARRTQSSADPPTHIAMTLVLRTISGIGWTSIGLGDGMNDADIVVCNVERPQSLSSFNLMDVSSSAETTPSIDSATPWRDTQVAAGGPGFGFDMQESFELRASVTNALNATELAQAEVNPNLDRDQLFFCRFVRPVVPFESENKKIHLPEAVSSFVPDPEGATPFPGSTELAELIMAWQFNSIEIAYHGDSRR